MMLFSKNTPAWLANVNELTGFKIRSIEFDEEQQRISGKFDPATCDWWVPDSADLASLTTSPCAAATQNTFTDINKRNAGQTD